MNNPNPIKSALSHLREAQELVFSLRHDRSTEALLEKIREAVREAENFQSGQ